MNEELLNFMERVAQRLRRTPQPYSDDAMTASDAWAAAVGSVASVIEDQLMEERNK
jgi:hypothetical protein